MVGRRSRMDMVGRCKMDKVKGRDGMDTMGRRGGMNKMEKRGEMENVGDKENKNPKTSGPSLPPPFVYFMHPPLHPTSSYPPYLTHSPFSSCLPNPLSPPYASLHLITPFLFYAPWTHSSSSSYSSSSFISVSYY